MIPVSIEGVRRNFGVSSVFQYSVFLLDETSQHLFVFGIERHEALPIVAALNHLDPATSRNHSCDGRYAQVAQLDAGRGTHRKSLHASPHLQSLRMTAALASWRSGTRASSQCAPRRCNGTKCFQVMHAEM